MAFWLALGLTACSLGVVMRFPGHYRCLPSDKVGVALSFYYQVRTLISKVHNRGSECPVVVGRHGVMVGPGNHERQDISRFESGQADPFDESVAFLAVFTDDSHGL